MANIINKLKSFKEKNEIGGLTGKLRSILSLGAYAEEYFNSKKIKNVLIQNSDNVRGNLYKLRGNIQDILKNNGILDFVDLGDGVIINLLPLKELTSAKLNDIYTDYLQYTRSYDYPLVLDEYSLDSQQVKSFINSIISPYVKSIVTSNQFTISSSENVFISKRSYDEVISNTIKGTNSLVYANVLHANYLLGNIQKDGKYKLEYKVVINENLDNSSNSDLNIKFTFNVNVDYIPEFQIDFGHVEDTINYSIKVYFDSTVFDNLKVEANSTEVYNGDFYSFISNTTSSYSFTVNNENVSSKLANTKNILSKIFSNFNLDNTSINYIDLDKILQNLKIKLEYGVVKLLGFNKSEYRYIYQDLARFTTLEKEISSVADINNKVIDISKFDHYYVSPTGSSNLVGQSYNKQFKLITNGYAFVMTVYFISDIVYYASTLTTVSEVYEMYNGNLSPYKTTYGSKIKTILYDFIDIDHKTSDYPLNLQNTVRSNISSFKNNVEKNNLKDLDNNLTHYNTTCNECNSVDNYIKGKGQIFLYKDGKIGDKYGILDFNDSTDYNFVFHGIILRDLFEIGDTILKKLGLDYDLGLGYLQGTISNLVNLNLKVVKKIYTLRGKVLSNEVITSPAMKFFFLDKFLEVLNLFYKSQVKYVTFNLYLDKNYFYDDIDDIDNKSSIYAEFGTKILYQNIESSIKNTLAYTFNPEEAFVPTFLPINLVQQADRFYSYGSVQFYTTKLNCQIEINDKNAIFSPYEIRFPITLKTEFINLYQKSDLIYRNYNMFIYLYNGYKDKYLTKILFDFRCSNENTLEIKVPQNIARNFEGYSFTNIDFVIYPNIEDSCIIRNCINIYSANNESCFKQITYSNTIEKDDPLKYSPSISLPSYESTGNIPIVVTNDLGSFSNSLFDIVEVNRIFYTINNNRTEDKQYFYKIPRTTDNIDYYPIKLNYTSYPFSISSIENKLKLEKDLKIELNYNYNLYKLLTMLSKNQKVYKISIGVRVFVPGVNNPNDPDRSNYQIFAGDVAKVTFENNKIIVLCKTVSIDYDKPVCITTSDFCPFEFKSADCGYKGPETICNKTQEDCARKFGSPDVAKTHFGGLFNITYYNKNVNIQRG